MELLGFEHYMYDYKSGMKYVFRGINLHQLTGESA